MRVSRSKLYVVALAGMALFGSLVLIDVLRPGLFPANLAIGAPLGLALCGLAVIVVRPRARRAAPPPDGGARDFSAVIEERRKLAEEAAQRPPRLPPE